MSAATDVAGGGDLTGIVDASSGDAGVVLQTNVGHTRAAENEIVEITHRPSAVDECVIGGVARGE